MSTNEHDIRALKEKTRSSCVWCNREGDPFRDVDVGWAHYLEFDGWVPTECQAPTVWDQIEALGYVTK